MIKSWGSKGGKIILKATFIFVALCCTPILATSESKFGDRSHIPLRQEYLYVVADGLYGYTLKANGTLKKINTGFPLVGQFPYFMASSRKGHFLYVCGAAARNNDHDGEVYTYSVAPDGKLKSVGITDAGSLPAWMAFDPSGHFLYCVSLDAPKNKNVILGYRVRHDGIPVPSTARPMSIAVGPISSLAFAQSGRFFLLAIRNTITSFRVSASGTLALLATASVRTSGNAYISTDPPGRYAYVASAGDNKIYQFRISSGGKLVPLTSPVVGSGKNPTSITTSPSGHFLYAVCDNGISQYGVRADGVLQPLPHPLLTLNTLEGHLAINQSGRFAYLTLTGGTEIGYVQQFSIKNGLLTPFKHPFVPVGVNPISSVIIQRQF